MTFDKIRALEVGHSVNWENAPLSCGMIAAALNDGKMQFSVRWITTNWEASQGYIRVTRYA
jgi:hypothetical protein